MDKKIEDVLRKIKPKYYPLLAFLLTLLTYTMAFSYMGLLSNGKYVIARSDMAEQYLPIINMFCDVLRGEKSYWFSWNLNSGSGTALLYAYYALSPFNLLFLLFGENHIMTAAALVILLKASLAAATFQIFITRFVKRTGYTSVLFAMMYALCGYQVCYYFNIMWMDAFYMLPVLALLITLLVREGKFLWLVPAYAYLFAVNFYAGYIAGMCTFFLFIFYSLYCGKRNGWKVTVGNMVKFGSSVLLAIGLTAVIWLPAIRILLNGMKDASGAIEDTRCNPLFIYNNLFMGQMQSLHGMTPYIYCGIMTFLLAPFYFLNKKIPKKERVFVLSFIIILVAITLIPGTNLFMHGMDDPDMFRYRYAYLFSFILCIIGYRECLYSFRISRKAILVFVGMNLLIYTGCYFLYEVVWEHKYNSNTIASALINLGFMLLWIFVAYLFWKRKQSRTACYLFMTIVLMIELGLNAGICFGAMEHQPVKQAEYEQWEERYHTAVNRVKENDSGLYRIEYFNNRMMNPCIRYDYCGIQSFTSSDMPKWTDLMEKFGYYRTAHTTADAGATEVTHMLLGVKYIIDGNTMEYTLDGNEFQPYEEAPVTLDLVYAVNSDILSYKSSDSPFENQDEVLSLMCGEKIRCYEETTASLKVTNGGYEEQQGLHILTQDSDKEPAQFRFNIKPSDERPLYVYFSQLVNGNVLDSPVVYTPDLIHNNNMEAVSIRLNPARIIKAGMEDNGDYKATIYFNEGATSDYFTNAYFCYYSPQELQKAYQMLKDGQITDLKFDENSLTGKIVIKENQMLFTSLPDDEGWQLWIDGNLCPKTSLLENAFWGAQITPGSHHITLKYDEPCVKIGMKISIIIGLVYALLALFCQIPRKRKSKNEFLHKIIINDYFMH